METALSHVKDVTGRANWWVFSVMLRAVFVRVLDRFDVLIVRERDVFRDAYLG